MIFKFYLLSIFIFMIKADIYINSIEIDEEEQKLIIKNTSIKVDNQIEKKFQLKSSKNPEIKNSKKSITYQESLENMYFDGESWIQINDLLKEAKKENITNLKITDLLRQQRNLVLISRLIGNMVDKIDFKIGCLKIQKDIEGIQFDLLNEESQLFIKKFDNCEINQFEDDAENIPEWKPDLDFENSDFDLENLENNINNLDNNEVDKENLESDKVEKENGEGKLNNEEL